MSRLKKFDPAEYLDDLQSQTELLADALASGNAGYVANALSVVARVRSSSKGATVLEERGPISDREVQEG